MIGRSRGRRVRQTVRTRMRNDLACFAQRPTMTPEEAQAILAQVELDEYGDLPELDEDF